MSPFPFSGGDRARLARLRRSSGGTFSFRAGQEVQLEEQGVVQEGQQALALELDQQHRRAEGKTLHGNRAEEQTGQPKSGEEFVVK